MGCLAKFTSWWRTAYRVTPIFKTILFDGTVVSIPLESGEQVFDLVGCSLYNFLIIIFEEIAIGLQGEARIDFSHFLLDPFQIVIVRQFFIWKWITSIALHCLHIGLEWLGHLVIEGSHVCIIIFTCMDAVVDTDRRTLNFLWKLVFNWRHAKILVEDWLLLCLSVHLVGLRERS